MLLLKKLHYVLALTVCVGACICVNAQGSGNQPIEREKGETDRVFPIAIEKPRDANECGGGKIAKTIDKVLPDVVLVYRTPSGGSGSPNDIRWWSTSPPLTWTMGSLAASGLTSPTTRVCVGARRHLTSKDYRCIYLWRKRSKVPPTYRPRRGVAGKGRRPLSVV